LVALSCVIGCHAAGSSAPGSGGSARELERREESRTLKIPSGSTAFSAFERDPATGGLLHPDRIYDALWAEATACMGPERCPDSDVERVRQKAAAAFDCPVDDVEVERRQDVRREAAQAAYRPEAFYMTVAIPDYGQQLSFTRSLTLAGLAMGDASVILRTETASFLQVAGCGRWGLLTCARANRTVHTPTMTYENTEDRVCLWGDPIVVLEPRSDGRGYQVRGRRPG
jgi:hypothetical protein